METFLNILAFPLFTLFSVAMIGFFYLPVFYVRLLTSVDTTKREEKHIKQLYRKDFYDYLRKKVSPELKDKDIKEYLDIVGKKIKVSKIDSYHAAIYRHSAVGGAGKMGSLVASQSMGINQAIKKIMKHYKKCDEKTIRKILRAEHIYLSRQGKFGIFMRYLKITYIPVVLFFAWVVYLVAVKIPNQ